MACGAERVAPGEPLRCQPDAPNQPVPADRLRGVIGTAGEEAARAGYATVVGYDVDPLDYQDPGFGPIVAATLATVQRGSIISLHLGHAQTIAALEVIVTGLRLRGLMPVTLRALLNP